MNSAHDFVEKITSGDIPADALGAVGIVLLLVAVKAAKRSLKLIYVILGLAALAGAVWWHFHKR
jgi:hypothetical protein